MCRQQSACWLLIVRFTTFCSRDLVKHFLLDPFKLLGDKTDYFSFFFHFNDFHELKEFALTAAYLQERSPENLSIKITKFGGNVFQANVFFWLSL